MKNGWEIKTLKDLCESIRDGSHNPPKGISSSEYLMLSSQNVQNGYLEMDKVRYLSESDFIAEDSRTKAKKGDVLLTIVGTIGRTCVLDGNEGKITFQRSVAILSPKAGVDSRFLMYGLMSLNDYLNNEATGAAQKGIYLKQLSRISLSIPPLSEQQRIVAILDTEFAKIEALKANVKKNLLNAKNLFSVALKKELMPRQGWRSYSIGDLFEITDFVSNGSFASLRENVKYYNEPNYAVLVRLVDNSNGFDTSKFVYVDKHGYDFLSKSRLFGGELILCNIGATIGKSFLCPYLDAPMTIGPNVLLIRTSNNRFYNYYLQSDSFQKQLRTIITKTTLEKFNKTQFKQLNICIPPTSQQNEIVSVLDELYTKSDALQANLTRTLSLCDDLKQSLLRRAFNGEL